MDFTERVGTRKLYEQEQRAVPFITADVLIIIDDFTDKSSLSCKMFELADRQFDSV